MLVGKISSPCCAVFLLVGLVTMLKNLAIARKLRFAVGSNARSCRKRAMILRSSMDTRNACRARLGRSLGAGEAHTGAFAAKVSLILYQRRVPLYAASHAPKAVQRDIWSRAQPLNAFARRVGSTSVVLPEDMRNACRALPSVWFLGAESTTHSRAAAVASS